MTSRDFPAYHVAGFVHYKDTDETRMLCTSKTGGVLTERLDNNIYLTYVATQYLENLMRVRRMKEV